MLLTTLGLVPSWKLLVHVYAFSFRAIPCPRVVLLYFIYMIDFIKFNKTEGLILLSCDNYRSLRIGHVRYINIVTWFRGFQVKLLYLLLQSLYPSLFWELRDKRNLKKFQFWPESLGSMLEYWYIELGQLPAKREGGLLQSFSVPKILSQKPHRSQQLWYAPQHDKQLASLFLPSSNNRKFYIWQSNYNHNITPCRKKIHIRSRTVTTLLGRF